MRFYQKIKLVFLLGPLALLLFSFRQKAVESKARVMHFSGPVKQCTETDYEVYFDSTKTAQLRFKSKVTTQFDPRGQSAGDIRYDNKGNIESSTVNKSDKNGNMGASDSYNDKGVLTRHSVYAYNNKGSKTMQRDEIYTKGVLNSVKITKYDSRQRVIKEVNTSYLQRKRTVTQTHYFPSSQKQTQPAVKSTQDKHDNEGRLIERIQYKPDGNIRSKQVYFYGADGFKNEWYMFKNDTVGLVKTNEIFFDSLGTVLKTCHYNNGELISTGSNNFVRDMQGNWITDSVFDNNKLTHLKQREIQYY